MRTPNLCGLALALNLTMAAAASAQTAESYIYLGDYQAQTGNVQAALSNYRLAYNLAMQNVDGYSMLTLAGKYLGVRDEQDAMWCFSMGTTLANQRIAWGGQYYYEGMSMLRTAVNYYNSTLRLIPVSPETQTWFTTQATAVNGYVASQTTAPPASGRPPLPRPACDGTGRSGTPNYDDLPCVPYFPR